MTKLCHANDSCKVCTGHQQCCLLFSLAAFTKETLDIKVATPLALLKLLELLLLYKDRRYSCTSTKAT
jgi:hypothetical protein